MKGNVIEVIDVPKKVWVSSTNKRVVGGYAVAGVGNEGLPYWESADRVMLSKGGKWVVMDKRNKVVAVSERHRYRLPLQLKWGGASKVLNLEHELPRSLSVITTCGCSGTYSLLFPATAIWRRYGRFESTRWLYHAPSLNEWVITSSRVDVSSTSLHGRIMCSIQGGSFMPQTVPAWSDPTATVAVTTAPQRPMTTQQRCGSRSPVPAVVHAPSPPALSCSSALSLGVPLKHAKRVASCGMPTPSPPLASRPMPPPEGIIQRQYDVIATTKRRLKRVFKKEGKAWVSLLKEFLESGHTACKCSIEQEEDNSYLLILSSEGIAGIMYKEMPARAAIERECFETFRERFEGSVTVSKIQYEEKQHRRALEDGSQPREIKLVHKRIVFEVRVHRERRYVQLECGWAVKQLMQTQLLMTEHWYRAQVHMAALVAGEDVKRNICLRQEAADRGNHFVRCKYLCLSLESESKKKVIEWDCSCFFRYLFLHKEYLVEHRLLRLEEVFARLQLEEACSRVGIAHDHDHDGIRILTMRRCSVLQVLCQKKGEELEAQQLYEHCVLHIMLKEAGGRILVIEESESTSLIRVAEENVRQILMGEEWAQRCELLCWVELQERTRLDNMERHAMEYLTAASYLVCSHYASRSVVAVEEQAESSYLMLLVYDVHFTAGLAPLVQHEETLVRVSVEHEFFSAWSAFVAPFAVALLSAIQQEALRHSELVRLDFMHQEYSARLEYSRALFIESMQQAAFRDHLDIARKEIYSDWLLEAFILYEASFRSGIMQDSERTHSMLLTAACCFAEGHILVQAARSGNAKTLRTNLKRVYTGFGRYERKSYFLRELFRKVRTCNGAMEALKKIVVLVAESLTKRENISINKSGLSEVLTILPLCSTLMGLIGYRLADGAFLFDFETWDISAFYATVAFIKRDAVPMGLQEHNPRVAREMTSILSRQGHTFKYRVVCAMVRVYLDPLQLSTFPSDVAQALLLIYEYNVETDSVSDHKLNESACCALQLHQCDILNHELHDCRDASMRSLAHLIAGYGVVVPNAYEKIFNNEVALIEDANGYTPLHTAAQMQNISMLNHLCTFLEPSLSPDGTPWHVALLHAKTSDQVLSIPDEHHAAVCMVNDTPMTPFHVVVHRVQVDACNLTAVVMSKNERLLEAVIKASPDTPLHLMAGIPAWDDHFKTETTIFGSSDSKQAALRMSLVTNAEGYVPLHVAIVAGCTKTALMLTLLLKSSDKPIPQFPVGSVALHELVKHKELCEGDLVEVFVTLSNVNSRDDEGATPLHSAAAVGNVAAIRKLLRVGAKTHATSNDKRTALHVVCMNCSFEDDHQDIIEDLAEGNLDSKDSNEATPFHYALQNGLENTSWTLVRLSFVEKVSYGPWQGRTLKQVAVSKNNWDADKLKKLLVPSGYMACLSEAQRLYLHRVAQEGRKPNAMLLEALQGDEMHILSLKNTYIGDAGVVALGRTLHVMKDLAVLDLRNNGVSNAACPVLCAGCLRSDSLHVLNVGQNRLITRKGGKDLLDLIASHPTLVHINVEGTMTSQYYASRIAAHGERKMAQLRAGEKEKWSQVIEMMRNVEHTIPIVKMESTEQLVSAVDDLPKEDAALVGMWRRSDRPLSSDDNILSASPTGFKGHLVVHNQPYDEEWLLSDEAEHQQPSPTQEFPSDQPVLKTYVQEGTSTVCISKDAAHNRVVFGYATPSSSSHHLLKTVTDDVAALFDLVDAYEPKNIEIDTPFKFPGKLNYMTAVGGPDCLLHPAPPSPLPPHTAPEPDSNNGMYWSFMTTSTPGVLKEQQPPVNPQEDLEKAIQDLQANIYYANIAPPSQYAGQAQQEEAQTQTDAVGDEEEEADEEGEVSEKKLTSQHFDGMHFASDKRCLNPIVAASIVRTTARPLTPCSPSGIPNFTTRSDPVTPEERHKSLVDRYLENSCLQINSIQPLIMKPAPGNTNGYHLHRVIKPTVGGLSRAARLTSGALNNTGCKLATGSYDLTAKVWDGNSGELLNTLRGHEGYVYDVIWNTPFCDRLVTASFDKTCKLWDAGTGECVHTLVGHDLEVVCVAVNQGSTLVASGSMDQTVIIWNALTGSQITMLHGHSAEIVCVDFSPANDLLASGSADETVRLWHSLTGECLALFEGHGGEVAAVKFNVHGNLVLSCSSDTTCRLWDTNTKRCKALKGHSKDVSDCEFSADGWLVASASEDMSARVWDTLSAGCISMMKGHHAGICCVSFGAGGQELLTGSADMTCRRWKVSTGECLQVLSGHKGVVISSYSFDGSVVLTISKDNSCRLWRKDTPNHPLVEYLLQYICGHPVLKSEVLEDARLPLHLKYRLKRTEGRMVEFVTPPPSPNFLAAPPMVCPGIKMTYRNDAYKALVPAPIKEDTDIVQWVKEVQNNAVEVLGKFKDEGKYGLLQLVVDLLEGFVCGNFTGDMTEQDKAERSEIFEFAAGSKESHRTCLDRLVVDGEVCNTNTSYPEFLVALTIFIEAEVEDDLPCIFLWRARTYFVHQRILAHRAHSLLSRILECYAEMLKLPENPDAPDTILSLTSHAEICLAKGLVHYYYHEPHHSNENIQKAHELSGMKSKLTSMMGVRTEHQVFETAQLVVKAQGCGKGNTGEYPFEPKVIEGSNVLARPRTLKESVAAGSVVDAGQLKYGEEIENDDITDTPLTDLEQALVMGLCVNVRNNNPMHGLTEVERLPYLERLIIEENMSWALRSQVYLLRSRMEQKRIRVRERGLMQFCELVDQFVHLVKNEQDEVVEKSSLHRMKGFWMVLFPTNFALKTELAGVYTGIGMLKSALDIHEALGNWTDIIKCCRRLDKRTKAESLIRERLEKTPNDAMLWSSLGDATRNAEYYEKAWEMSNHKLAAPMRGLGELYLEVEKFAEAVECFDKALTLNPIFGADWFSMGWAAIKTKQWERASFCYTRNVQLDMQDGHSWSNLATCNLQMNKLIPAFHCLVQAKKWSPANWRIWDNLYTVSVEIGEKQKAINTMLEIIESKGRNYTVRPDVLAHLTQQVLDVIAGKAEVSRPAEKIKEEHPDEFDDEIFDVVPFGADMDLEIEDTIKWREEQAKKKKQQEEDVEKAKLAAVEHLRQEHHKLLGKVTSTITSDAMLYKTFGDFLDGITNHLEAFDQRLKDLRCQMKKGWQVDKTTATGVIESAVRVVKGAKLVTEEALGERKVKTTPPKSQALMQVQPVLKLAEDYASLPAYMTLKEEVESLS